MIHVRIRCDVDSCHEQILRKPKCGKLIEWEGDIEEYQLGLVAIWFHSMHEGHLFSYWENGELILGKGDMPVGNSVSQVQ